MNILLLMAGGSRKYEEAGYLYPKNLFEIGGTPLVECVIGELSALQSAGNRFIFVIDQEEDQRYHTGSVIRLLLPEAEVLKVSMPTAGAACTSLLAIDYVDNEDPLLIVNGDIAGDLEIIHAIHSFQYRQLDGGIVVFEGVHPRWSYVKCDELGLVVETAEKRPISKLATVGVYYFARGSDFVCAAQAMIKKDAHVDNLFYVCPAFNEMILMQKRIGVHEIPRKAYFSLATPQGAQAYADHLNSVEGSRRRGDEN